MELRETTNTRTGWLYPGEQKKLISQKEKNKAVPQGEDKTT